MHQNKAKLLKTDLAKGEKVCIVYLKLCSVSFYLLDITWHSVNFTQTVLILLENSLSTLCVADDHFHSL